MSLFDRFVSSEDLECPPWLRADSFDAIVEATRQGFSILEAFLEKPCYTRKRTAVTIDIDNTLFYTETEQPILPVRGLYRAIESITRPMIAIFIISARSPLNRMEARKKLRLAGYDGWAKTYFVDNKQSGASLNQPTNDASGKGRRKADVRAQIEGQGYTILMNIGDDPTDHMYGHYQHAIFLPRLPKIADRPRKLLYVYRLEVLGIEVHEVKYMDVPEDAPLTEKYQWFLRSFRCAPKPLTFVRQEGTRRVFKEGITIDTNTQFAKETGDHVNSPTITFVMTTYSPL